MRLAPVDGTVEPFCVITVALDAHDRIVRGDKSAMAQRLWDSATEVKGISGCGAILRLSRCLAYNCFVPEHSLALACEIWRLTFLWLVFLVQGIMLNAIRFYLPKLYVRVPWHRCLSSSVLLSVGRKPRKVLRLLALALLF